MTSGPKNGFSCSMPRSRVCATVLSRRGIQPHQLRTKLAWRIFGGTPPSVQHRGVVAQVGVEEVLDRMQPLRLAGGRCQRQQSAIRLDDQPLGGEAQ